MVFSFNSWDYCGHTSLVITVGCVIARRHDVEICLLLSFNSWDYFGHTSLVMTMGYVIARRHDLAICLFLVSFMRLLRLCFPRNDGWFRHCEEARRGNLFVFSFTSWDYHVFRSSFLVMTVGCVIARRHDVEIC